MPVRKPQAGRIGQRVIQEFGNPLMDTVARHLRR